ncbi:SH3 domain-containing protein [Paenibacillus sp. GCM10023252]|uniref:C40 family peptidase n=1 Tax=Paenibacillus sp. GCM10023252 TaxID=3252649 RepID=UPI003608DD5A
MPSRTIRGKLITATLTTALVFGSISIPAALAAQTATVQQSVNFRTEPSASASIIRTLKPGEPLSIIEKVNDYWYRAQDTSGRVGYVTAGEGYIQLSSQTGNTSGSAVIIRSVSFRTSPSTDAARIRYLQAGEKVQVISSPNAYWYEVQDASGKRGYVSSSSEYIQVNGGTSPAPSPTPSPGPIQGSVEKVISAGMKYLGTPYEYGSDRNSTATFDCSDFVRQAFLDGAGLKLPADSRGQGEFVKNRGAAVTDWRQLKRGDIIFFMSYRGSKASSYAGINKSKQSITHDGIYLGDGKVLHTYSKESGGVRISSMAGTHWEYRFLFGGSAL